MTDTVSIQGLDKAAVLAALYNASHPQGLGFLKFDAAPMTIEEARGILETQQHFDYLKGRVMKISLDSDVLNTAGYDRDNGGGAAAFVISVLRATDNPNALSIEMLHQTGTEEAAWAAVDEPTDYPVRSEGDTLIFTLGMNSDAQQIARDLLDENED